MKRLYLIALCSVIIVGLLLSSGCTKRAREEARKERRGDIKARITELKKHAITKTMELDEATLNKVIEVTDGYDERKIALFKQRRENLEALRTALKSEKATDLEVKALIDALDKSDEDLFMLRQEEQKELSTFLTTQQLGRYLLFDEKFRREVRRHIESKKDSRRNKWKWDGRAGK
jgi:uncharacterized protein YicC (UPF0701 family)